jgi:hypothetical protein
MLDYLLTKIVMAGRTPVNSDRILEEVRLENRAAARRIASRYSRGSVLLQQGRVLTKEDVEKEFTMNK